MPAESPLKQLASLHRRIDEAAARVAALHGPRLVCASGCSGCCVDEITVFELEAERIRQAHPDLLANGIAAPVGGCAFLDEEGACRVYAVRPYVCRTQGLPLRWIDEEREVELRDICELNDGEPAIETLDEAYCWTLGPFEEELAQLQTEQDGGTMRRVALRSLFAAQR